MHGNYDIIRNVLSQVQSLLSKKKKKKNFNFRRKKQYLILSHLLLLRNYKEESYQFEHIMKFISRVW
jgi:hypothetical protein